MINVPAALGQLPFENVADATPLESRVHFAAPVHEHDVVGAQRAINQHLAAPMPVRFLLPPKIFLCSRNRLSDLFVGRRVGFRGFGRPWQDYQLVRRHLDCSAGFRGWLRALAGEMTISRADTVVSKHFTATSG